VFILLSISAHHKARPPGQVCLEADVPIFVAANFLAAEHVVNHPVFEAHIDPVSCVVGQEFPNDLIELRPRPVRRLVLVAEWNARGR
jgi:hypothetical protein